MSDLKVSLTPDPKLLKLIMALANEKKFVELMAYAESRCTGLALWGHNVKDDVQRLWVGGRVQELSDWLNLYHNRAKFVDMSKEPPADAGGIL